MTFVIALSILFVGLCIGGFVTVSQKVSSLLVMAYYFDIFILAFVGGFRRKCCIVAVVEESTVSSQSDKS